MTGTFWPANQPVTVGNPVTAVTANPPVGTPLALTGSITTLLATTNQGVLQTASTLTGSAALTNNTYTVPAGKKLVLLTFDISATDLTGIVKILNYGNASLLVNGFVFWNQNVGGDGTAYPNALAPPGRVILPAGTTVRVGVTQLLTTSTRWAANLMGVLEDA